MKIIRILLVVLSCITFRAGAQSNLPPVYELKNDTGAKIILGPEFFQVLPFPSQSITINDVLHKSAEKYFVKFHDSIFNYGGKGSAWFRFRIRNSTGRDIILDFMNSQNQSVYYIKNASGTWKEFKTGYKVPYSKRSGLKRQMQVLFPVKDNEEIIVYKKMEWSADAEYVAPSLGIFDSADGSIANDDTAYFESVIGAALFGFMLFAAIFNFFFYYIVRERVYLLYAITLLSAAAYNILEPVSVLFLREHPSIAYSLQSLLVFILLILVPFTMRLFLQTKKIFPVWDKFLVYFPLIMIGLVIILKYTVPSSLFGTALNYAGIGLIVAYLVGIIIMLIIYLRRKDTNARLLTLALIPFFVGVLASMRDSYDWVTIAGLIWAVGVISWSLFVRFRALMNENSLQALEKEKLAREKEEERNFLIAQQNELLEKQVAERTAELQQSLTELKQTQTQLIQSEKMASLGELTAGIAHEIQNPLNFVNNFSDVSIELLDEMGEELDKGDIEEAKALSADIKQNLEKINHHGKRADGIVKGMLQHSRASSGQKEPTDINALADEYLRLAYHGLRAKDKSFNAELITHFDEDIPNINIVPQDVGRVLLNLFTNAFYATQEKMKSPPAPEGGEAEAYKPTVSVITSQKENSIVIKVKDNGTGIPDAIKDKILQPFFTTKPTGEGTGLGLSLSYDIVIKGHGGSIAIESKEGEGAEFIITLPV